MKPKRYFFIFYYLGIMDFLKNCILHFYHTTVENLFSRFQQHANEIPSAENRPDGTQIFGYY